MESILKGSRTLAILFGASEFPRYTDGRLDAPESFQRSVEQFKSYLLDSLKLNPDNICDLFDTELEPLKLANHITDWVSERKASGAVTDVFFYYVGHGVIDSGSFCMASRTTSSGLVTESSLSTKTLKNVLYKVASGSNFYIILDCCYSATAYEDFQDTSSKGPTVLYTSAGARAESKAPASELYTRFSDALFAALRQGVESTDEYLSFFQLECKVAQIYQDRHQEEFVRPQLGAPNAPKINILQQPVFPNAGCHEAPKQYEYFTRWIRRRGVPEGVGPITMQQAKQRQSSTRMLREQGRIRRVETVNSSGTLAANYYNSALLGGSPDTQDSQDQECSWEFVYHENGRVAREEVRNAFGRLLYRCEYSVSEEADSTARYFLKLSDLVRPRAKSGAAFVKIFRDERGVDQRFEFFDGSEQQKPDDLGSYGREFKVNGDGLEMRVVELDREGKPALCKDGYAITEYSNDLFGNTTSQMYFDAGERPVLYKDGYHKAVMEWSPEGNWIGIKFFGIDSEPVLIKGGWASWTSHYDGGGNLKKREFFGLDNQPVAIGEGYARWEAEYNEQGRVTAMRFFDAGGNPAYSRDGVSQVVYKYDISGKVEEYQYLDAKGMPAVDRCSVSRRVITFDDLGNVTTQKFLDVEGRGTRDTDGIAGYQAKYDSEGNQILLTFLDSKGSPGCNNSGYAKIRRCFDDRRRLTEECYFYVDDSPAENADGHHRILYAYDEVPGSTLTRFFDRKGAQAFLDGYWTEQAQSDDRGNLVSREFRDDAGQPCWHAQGFAREERSYDPLSRQTHQRYLGIDGKLVMTTWGYAGWDAEHDGRGNCTRTVYVDTGGNPVAGRPIEVTRYDELGNYVMKYLNAEGEPILNEN
jgi:hypothetical protein